MMCVIALRFCRGYLDGCLTAWDVVCYSCKVLSGLSGRMLDCVG
jgi:hypothetical protein